MAGQRSLVTRGANINGRPLMKELDSATYPEMKKVMQEVRGGAFIPGEIWVGMEKMTASFTVNGADQELLSAYGLDADEQCQVTIKEAHQDEEGKKFSVVHNMTGQITSVKLSNSKLGEKPNHEIQMSVNAYKHTEAGKIIYDVDRNAQILDLGKGDLMAEHRRNAGF